MAFTINREEVYPSSLTNDPHILTVTIDGTPYHINKSATIAKKLRLRNPEGNLIDMSPELEAKIFEAIADAQNNKGALDAQGSLEYGNQNTAELLPYEPADNNLGHAVKNYFNELSYRAKTDPSSIALLGKYTMPAIAASTLLPLLGKAAATTSIASIPITTWINTAATAGFAGHGLNHWLNEGINGWGDAAMTALEVAPLGKLARPLWNAGKNNARAFYNNLAMDLTSTPGTYYVGYPKRDISTLMPGKTGGIFLTPDKKFARGYTGAFGTGKVYETNINFGKNPIHIDAKGNYFDRIAEQDLLEAFNTTAEEMRELGLKPFYTKKGLFSKKLPQRYYHIDEISTFGKKKGASSLIVDNVYDQGPGIFGFGTKGVGQQVIVYSPEQISLVKGSHSIKSTIPQITAENAAENGMGSSIGSINIEQSLDNISRFKGSSPIPTGHQGMVGYRPKQKTAVWDSVKQDMIPLKSIDEVPNLRKTINSILRRIKTEDIKPEFLNENAYVNAFRDNATRQGININDLSHEDVAKILTEQYNQLREGSSGILRDNILWRTWGRTWPQAKFSWQEHLGEFENNKGFWGGGNYFGTGVYGNNPVNQPYMIKGIEEIGYDDLLGATEKAGYAMREGKIAGEPLATKWMSESPDTRIVAATENGTKNRYGWLDTGDQGIEIVTLKNTGIKALNPDLTIGNGETFPRDWSNPDVFKGLLPFLGLGAAGTLYGKQE